MWAKPVRQFLVTVKQDDLAIMTLADGDVLSGQTSAAVVRLHQVLLAAILAIEVLRERARLVFGKNKGECTRRLHERSMRIVAPARRDREALVEKGDEARQVVVCAHD